jgi:hypothetical protein
MAFPHVAFELQDGFVHNWLVAGPHAIPVVSSSEAQGKLDPQQVAQMFYEENSGITRAPVEVGPLEKGKFQVGDYQGEWTYYRCREDHRIELSTKRSTVHFLRAWAFTKLASPQPQAAVLSLEVYGPVDLWVNKKQVFHSDSFGKTGHKHSVPVSLKKGTNQVLVRFAGIASPDCVLACAVHIQAEGVSVQIPTLVPSINRRNELESIYEDIYFDRDIYADNQKIRLCWPEGPEKAAAQDARLMNQQGFIFGQAEEIGTPGKAVTFAVPPSLEEGIYHGLITPRGWEYYERGTRITKTLTIWCAGRNQFSQSPYGSPESRREEALQNAARRGKNLFAEVAKMALGAWEKLDQKSITGAVEAVQQQAFGSELLLVGLLGMLARFGEQPAFPAMLPGLIRAASLQYAYRTAPTTPEDAQLLLLAGQILAGQAFPAETFVGYGVNGAQLREQGEALAVDWMRERALNGFYAWDSTNNFANIMAGLSYLIGLSQSETVFELASVLMDKLHFSIALNSHRGVFGSSQRIAATENIKGGIAAATAGITRLFYGLGIFNYHIESTVSLALMENYEFPPIIAEIASGTSEPVWNREQQGQGESAVNKVSYRTADYMLSSAQDFHPGEPGHQEHIWQATFGPQSVVFVNHPGSSYQNDSHTPGYWLGNGTLPRVAQWKDTLLALYNLPDDDVLGFTHAYFPTYEFDEYVLTGNTAFMRTGEGYLALTAAQGLEMLTTGHTAYRELRSYGRQNIWICQMGQAATEGDFAAFQEKIRAQTIVLDHLQVELQSLREERLQFSWDGPLMINQQEQPLSGFPHYENPYTVTALSSNQMEIRTENYLLRLDYTGLD